MAAKHYVVQEFDFDGLRDVWMDLRTADPTEDWATAVKIRDRARHSGRRLRIVQRTEEVIEES